jgi:hypothetical protein
LEQSDARGRRPQNLDRLPHLLRTSRARGQVVPAYLLIILSTHQHPERTNTTNSRGEGKQEEITLGQPIEDDHEARQ